MKHPEKTTLENGVRVVTQSMPGVRSAAIGVLVGVGSSNEPPSQSGIAHLCEHLVFQGTSNRSARDIALLMDGAGGQVGGFTGRDYTCYFAVVLDEHSTYAIDLLGDVLLNPVLSEEAIERERRAIGNEIRTLADQPERLAHQLMKARAWPEHPLGRPVTGDLESLETLTREDLIYFLQESYSPDRLVVAAAGRVDHRDFVAQARDAFWRLLSRNPLPRPAPAPGGSGVQVLEGNCHQAYFSLGIPAPAYDSDERYGVHLLCEVLGGGLSSRLFHVLRETDGSVYDISATYESFRSGGLIVLEGSTDPAILEEVVARALQVAVDLLTWREPLDAEEELRAKTRLRAQIALAGESPHSVMSRLLTQEFYLERHETEEEMAAAITEWSPTSLARLARSLAAGLHHLSLAVVMSTVMEGLKNSLSQTLAQMASGVTMAAESASGDGVREKSLIAEVS